MEAQKKRLVLTLALLAAAVALAVAGYFLLPAELVVQIGLNGQASNTMPKLLALLLPLGLSAYFSLAYYKGGQGKSLAFAVLALALNALLFVFN